jgi:bifunctional non-homologous end joining protein LigD
MRAQFIEPMLATLVPQPPDGDDWIHEIKHDGYRSQLALQEGKVQAFTRRGADWTAKYSSVVKDAADLPGRSSWRHREFVLSSAKSTYAALRSA